MSVVNPAIEPIKFLIGTWEAIEAKASPVKLLIFDI